MKPREQFGFRIQYLLGRLFIFIAAPVISLAIRFCGYRVSRLAETRAAVRARLQNHAGPWLICANHLTMIDSVLITHILLACHRYAIQYRLMPWNLPEKINLYRIHPLVAWLCYLLKCIPVERGGCRDTVNRSIAKCTQVLGRGESLIIFPEGRRSRSGRIDIEDFPYTVGRFVQMVPHCRVLCIYVRGDHQAAYSDLPKFKEQFFVAVEDFKPATALKGLKAQREFSRQIIEKLAEMEKIYFGARGQRYC